MASKVLVSACLLGQRVRYDGGHARADDAALQMLLDVDRVIPFCPEVAGGLPTPRPPAEIREGRVVEETGGDVTDAFDRGAEKALTLCQRHGITVAVLKQNSPSCGSAFIYDGTFSGQKIEGQGRTAALLSANGIRVFGEDRLAEALALLER
ncbi:DUF523 domain-containing protein [Aestuariispira ectoiniformans]|uniref:DUF523 domain-containing protein n=1 Tax=Aestuariispira ectoiniformans TaxID=2775080 RepID=UPI00223B8EE6|nr:DUF523 domain-containing protein [Aestuariispira ectoiniformans]